MPAMSRAEEAVNQEVCDFKWGKKRGRGGKKKEVQFYESFTYDRVEYSLYDCVYLLPEDETEPYIGKLIKMWEQPKNEKNKQPKIEKRVKILWFFRPMEIQNWLGDVLPLENELFLASGEGVGLANVNDLDRSKWFKGLPWEERMQTAHEQGTLVLLSNLYPGYSSADVEEIVWEGFREKCSAKMVQRTATSSPHCGQAFVIFRTREAAETAMRKLDEGCFLLPNGSPLVGSRVTPLMPGTPCTFYGHIFIEKLRPQMQREEMKRAVSTSHYSQPNTIEYDMAMEWRLLQARSENWWKALYKRHGDELKKLKGNLKSK